jgi:hypothetical protein
MTTEQVDQRIKVVALRLALFAIALALLGEYLAK